MNQANQDIRKKKLAFLTEELNQKKIDGKIALQVAYNFGWDKAKEDTIERFSSYILDESDPENDD